MDIASVLTPDRENTQTGSHASVRARSRASARTRKPANTEILHVYMPAELKEKFRKIQAELQLEHGETWKLSEIARAVLGIGLDAGQDEIMRALDLARPV